MVPLAALLLEEGHRVSGSDGPLYPPMSTTLDGSLTPTVGSNSNASVRVNMVAAAPMPSASETIEVRVNTGLRPSSRTA